MSVEFKEMDVLTVHSCAIEGTKFYETEGMRVLRNNRGKHTVSVEMIVKRIMKRVGKVR